MTNWTKLYREGVDLDEEFEPFEPISGSRLDTEPDDLYIHIEETPTEKEDDQTN